MPQREENSHLVNLVGEYGVQDVLIGEKLHGEDINGISHEPGLVHVHQDTQQSAHSAHDSHPWEMSSSGD